MALIIITDNYPPEPGGIGTYAYELAKNLFKDSVEVMVFAPTAKGNSDVDAEEKFTTYRLVKKRPFFELHAFMLLIYLTFQGRVDRICCMTWNPCGIVAMLVGFLFNVPYYVFAHGGELLEATEGLLSRLKYRGLLGPLKSPVLGKASAIFANSNYTKKLLVSLGVPERKINVIPCGTDPHRFKSARNGSETAKKYGLEGNKKVLLTVARLESHKGQDTVISLMPELIKKIPNLIYIVAGTGRQESMLKDMVRRLNLNEKVQLIGSVPKEELTVLYNACDVFIMVSKELPSEFEGFGVVFLEANACGKPVIGGRSGGIPEAVIHGETGLLVNPNNPKEVMEAVVKLFTDDCLARKLGERGRQRVAQELNWTTTARRVRDAIYSLPGM